MELTPLSVLLVVLVAAGIWALVELALAIRKARASVDQITRSANETIEQVQPIIAKLDGAMDDLQPAIKQVDPLVGKAGVALDGTNESLARVNGILDDVSAVSGTAAGVSGAVGQVATNAAASVSGLVSRVAGKVAQPARIEEAPDKGDAHGEVRPGSSASGSGYVTYGESAPLEDESKEN